ncbi:hypothetical protein CNMCM6805_002454 [Aspergillus fumigatiaffinis]|uniref:Uncharacterized protein n=1 Tax=Aspergillus fumigatiaffinis TaxID=340414 RepID=A0A8H4M3L7_9EURO|nr:hypothetical protein CNMCM6805_002454 [Aspergillus fumigatiaffinis]
MVTLSSLTAALATVGVSLLLFTNGATATPGFRNAAGPSYRSSDVCPERCCVSGANTGNWSVYPDFKQIRKCKQAMFYYFSVDDKDVNHKIHACSSYGPDFGGIPASAARIASTQSVDVECEMGWWSEGFGLAASGLRSLVKQLSVYAENGHGATDRPFIIYGQSGQATIGLYIGQGLLNQGLGASALKIFHDNLENLNVSTPTLAMQLCKSEYDSTHIFGIMATSRGTFTPIQDAIKSWANATCLPFEGSTKFPGTAQFTTPLLHANRTVTTNSTLVPTASVARSRLNPATLVKDNDNCDNLAAEYSLTRDDLAEFNKDTWGWNGCQLLYKDTVMCLSEGTAPFPAPIANAVCGPQKPGSKLPTDGLDIADVNPCPLNACCNIWEQCGITKDFCIDTNTGAPGTAEPGTYGCIFNCRMDVVKGDGTGAIKIAYYEGYCLSRQCLFQDASQIDTSAYTHGHFGFGTETSGPGAQLIWNSQVKIHVLHKDYYNALFEVAALTSTALKDLENKFAPIPPEQHNTWLLLLIDLLTLGFFGTARPLFNSFLRRMPYFLERGTALDNIKDTSMTLIGQSTTIAKDVLPSEDAPWTPEAQDEFSNYVGHEHSLQILKDTMSGGKLIEGAFEQVPPENEDTDKNILRANIQKCFFGYSIPSLWQVSKTYAFIIDAGHSCGEKQLTDYLKDETMDATGVCVDDQQYYLVYAEGEAITCRCEFYDGGPCQRICVDNKFSMPPGLDSLGNGNFDGITKDDLVKGSVRTWKRNGKENGGGFADPTNKARSTT